jgi:hypothetical protein
MGVCILSPDNWIECIVQSTSVGWWLLFPGDLKACLLFDTDAEKAVFARDCGVDLDDEDLLLALDLGEITRCPLTYYQSAKLFREPYWGEK